jgi:hypothetical protein
MTETEKTEKKPRNVRTGTKVAHDALVGKFDGIVAVEKAGYIHFGARGGIRVAVSKSQRVGRVLVYKGEAVTDVAILQYSKEDAKAKKVGRATGEVDFSKTDAEIFAACEKLAAAIKAAPPVAPKKAKEPKAPKA